MGRKKAKRNHKVKGAMSQTPSSGKKETMFCSWNNLQQRKGQHDVIDVRFFSRALHADRCSDFPTKCRCHRGGRHTIRCYFQTCSVHLKIAESRLKQMLDSFGLALFKRYRMSLLILFYYCLVSSFDRGINRCASYTLLVDSGCSR